MRRPRHRGGREGRQALREVHRSRFLNSPDRTTVELLNLHGDPLTTFSFKPAPDAGVMIDGKKTKFTDLKKGEKISFYVSADRLTASELPGATEDSWAVLPPTK